MLRGDPSELMGSAVQALVNESVWEHQPKKVAKLKQAAKGNRGDRMAGEYVIGQQPAEILQLRSDNFWHGATILARSR